MESDLGRHYSLHPDIKITLDSCFTENCRFPAKGVDPDPTVSCGVLSG